MTLFGCCLSRLDSSLLSAPHTVSEWIVLENLSLIVVKFSPPPPLTINNLYHYGIDRLDEVRQLL